MNKLTITDKVFVPVNEKTDYVICHNESDLGKEDIIWNVKDETDKYLLSKEELEKVISDAFEAGANREYQERNYERRDYVAPTKEQYINSIL